MTTTNARVQSAPVLLIPGIGNSGPDHWQTRWQAAAPNYRRVMQGDWDHPRCHEWAAALEQAVAQAGERSVLVAHSLGCLLVAHWMQGTRLRVAGALLVAVPDPDGSRFPAEAIGFAPVPRSRLPCASILVTSQDDSYASPGFAHGCAASWGSRLVDIGRAGHINAASGLGNWAAGQDLLGHFTS